MVSSEAFCQVVSGGRVLKRPSGVAARSPLDTGCSIEIEEGKTHLTKAETVMSLWTIMKTLSCPLLWAFALLSEIGIVQWRRSH